MNTEIKNSIEATELRAQYDEHAKRVLSNKMILAHILIKSVKEFRGMSPKLVSTYIEGDPILSIVPVEPGLTNKEFEEGSRRIVGINTENNEVNEGLVRFDIIFYVRMKNGLSQIIVNVEAQKSEPTVYDILNRAIFYVSRIISSQKSRDFVGMNYNDIKAVYSIWVCMGVDENCLNHIHLINDSILGNHSWKGNIDLFNIVMIGLTDEIPKNESEYEMHRLLSTLLSQKLSVEQKLNIIENEYSIEIDDALNEEVSSMCNLSQGIWERGEAQGRAEGVAQGRVEGVAQIIIQLNKAHYPIEDIAKVADMTIEEVQKIINNEKNVFVDVQ